MDLVSAHRRHVWHRHAAQHLRTLLTSWSPAGPAARRQRAVVDRLDELLRVLPLPRSARRPRHAAIPEVRRRTA